LRTLVRIVFGSHLYGTSTPDSDFDFKSVYLPDARAILLQRVAGSIVTRRAKAVGEANRPGDVDEEAYSLQRYLELLAEGQTVATDLLFAPEARMTEPPSAEWREIVANRARLISSKSAAFVAYCREQANKYGIKGSRVAAAHAALALLDEEAPARGARAKLGDIAEPIGKLVAQTDHMAIVSVAHISGASVDHWEVCGRKLSFQASIKTAREIIGALVSSHGRRAIQAASQRGVDWKALSHAVRVARQAVELLSTGEIVFPLRDAPRLLAIKRGEVPYAEVAADIEQGLLDVETASAKSTLPREPDHAWIDEFVARTYAGVVVSSRAEAR
jgi:hypothetical protein